MKRILLACLLSPGLISSVDAGLIGDTVNADILQDGTPFGELDVVVVGAGPEGNWEGQIEYDLDSDSITVSSLISSNAWADNLSFSFTDLDWINPGPGSIVGINVTNATGAGWSLIDNSDVTFTASSVLIDASEIFNVPTALDQSITVQLIVDHAVPEPSTFVLLGIGGIALIGYARRRKKQVA